MAEGVRSGSRRSDLRLGRSGRALVGQTRRGVGLTSAVPKPGESLADLFPELAAEWHPTKNVAVSGSRHEEATRGASP